MKNNPIKNNPLIKSPRRSLHVETPMKWHKVLIYFSIPLSILVYFANALSYFNETANLPKEAESAKPLLIFIGIMNFLMACAMLAAEISLCQKNKYAVSIVKGAYISIAAVNFLIAIVLDASGLSELTGEPLRSFFTASVLSVVVWIYYNKRKHMFGDPILSQEIALPDSAPAFPSAPEGVLNLAADMSEPQKEIYAKELAAISGSLSADGRYNIREYAVVSELGVPLEDYAQIKALSDCQNDSEVKSLVEICSDQHAMSENAKTILLAVLDQVPPDTETLSKAIVNYAWDKAEQTLPKATVKAIDSYQNYIQTTMFDYFRIDERELIL